MKKSLVAASLFVPCAAFAHEGHGGIGLFHHMYDLLPVVGAVIIVAGLWLAKKRG
ncbi:MULTISPECIES: hypothetical protein [Shewanella]|uniref:hypothetical protein n=1 Tax=Shewanella TaxID=22 RepID=UPI0013EE97D4|nr:MULTISPECIES: hypothetical protein [Shewanella]